MANSNNFTKQNILDAVKYIDKNGIPDKNKSAKYEFAFEMGYLENDYDYGFELYFGLLKEHLMAYSSLSGNGVQRYEWVDHKKPDC